MTRLLSAAVAGAALVALAGCSSAASSTPPAPQSSAPAAAARLPPPAAVASLGPLTLGNFPSTTDGSLARAVCQAWSGLRMSYASDVVNDSPVQLNQWFSGPNWATPNADITQLGDDPAFTHLEADYGVATLGDTASAANARNLDKACEDAD